VALSSPSTVNRRVVLIRNSLFHRYLMLVDHWLTLRSLVNPEEGTLTSGEKLPRT
jgi:DNA polymerase sigma